MFLEAKICKTFQKSEGTITISKKQQSPQKETVLSSCTVCTLNALLSNVNRGLDIGSFSWYRIPDISAHFSAAIPIPTPDTSSLGYRIPNTGHRYPKKLVIPDTDTNPWLQLSVECQTSIFAEVSDFILFFFLENRSFICFVHT